jgi:hypothetical protein
MILLKMGRLAIYILYAHIVVVPCLSMGSSKASLLSLRASSWMAKNEKQDTATPVNIEESQHAHGQINQQIPVSFR